MQETAEVRRLLSQRCQVQVPDDWLEACIDWIKSENQGRAVELKVSELSESVYEQWLVSDLRELANSSLPQAVGTEQKYTLNGKYCLQIDSVIDVSAPYYGQLQKIQGTENENVQVSAVMPSQPAAKTSRMLMLKLTDGVMNVQGMEYEIIPGLHTHLPAGTKVLVTGPVLCRLGVLMLKKNNVTVLGGEVDTLQEANTQEQLLQTALESKKDFAERPEERKAKFDTAPRVATQPPPARRSSGQHGQRNHAPPPADIGDEEMMAMLDDDDFLDQVPAAQLDAMEQQWEDDDIDEGILLEHTNFQNTITQPTPTPIETQRNTQTVISRPTPVSNSHSAQTNSDTFQARKKQRLSAESMPARSELSRNTTNTVSVNQSRQTNSGSNFSNQNVVGSVKAENNASNSNTFQAGNIGTRNSFSNQNVVSSIKTESNTFHQNKPQTDNSGRPTSFSNQRLVSDTAKPAHFGVPVHQIKTETNDRSTNRPSSSSDQKSVANTGVSPQNTANFKTENKPANSRPQNIHGVILTGNFNNCEFNVNVSASVKMSVIQEQQKSAIGPSGSMIKKKQMFGIDAKPYTYLQVVTRAWPTSSSQTASVKAYISTLVSKLDSNKGSHWSLTVKINDGTAALDVDLADQVLTALIGFSAQECMVLKANSKQDKNSKIRMVQGIRSCQMKIIQWTGILQLSLSPGQPKPIVTGFRRLTPEDCNALQSRLSNSS